MNFLWPFIFLLPSTLALPYVYPAVPFTFRNATIDDIDDITTVWIDAFKPSPIFSYIRQFADEVGEEYTWTCQRDSYLALFQQHVGDYRFRVITVPESTSLLGEKVVSVSVWDFSRTGLHHGDELSLPSLSPLFARTLSQTSHSSVNNRHVSDFNCSAHLDMNLTRAFHFKHLIEDAERTYLINPFGTQLYLGLLATHPSWDGHGFAAQHLRWGKTQMELLRKTLGDRLPMTLLATPAGYPLSVDEGFTGLKNITLERLDGKGAFWYEAMAYEQSSDEAEEL